MWREHKTFLDCLATKRFDTGAPDKFISIVLRIDDDQGGVSGGLEHHAFHGAGHEIGHHAIHRHAGSGDQDAGLPGGHERRA